AEKNLSPSDKKEDKQKNLTQALFDYVEKEAEAPVASTSGTSETSKTSNLPEPKIVERSQKDQLETSKLPEPIELISGVAPLMRLLKKLILPSLSMKYHLPYF
ncbi:27992_t:CDS:1, partial [Dentiscutata erythropus]